jgi:hypothetical protein
VGLYFSDNGYINKAYVQVSLRAKIKAVCLEFLPDGFAGERCQKPVVEFMEDIPRLILNITNLHTIRRAYGPNTDRWTGRVIEMYEDPNVMFNDKKVGGVRVRIPVEDKKSKTEIVNAGTVPAASESR